jgi:signal transduction histidine kinase/CHASE1-domain containing sensor protein
MYPRRYTLIFQAVVLIVCLMLSYFCFALVGKIVQTKSTENFKVLTDQGFASLDRRFEEYQRTLDAVTGLFLASEIVTANEMAIYNNALDIAHSMSSIDAIGFATNGHADSPLFGGAAMPAQSLLTDVGETGTTPDRFIVRYIEPFETHKNLLGFDFSSLPALADAAQHARDSGETALSLRFSAPPVAGQDLQAVMIKPIFAPAIPAATRGTDQGAFLGYAFVTIDLQSAFQTLTAAQGDLVELHVSEAPHDHQTPDSGARNTAAPYEKSNFTLVQDFQTFGHPLALTWYSTANFDTIQPFRARWIVLALGLFVTALISLILNVVIRRERTIAVLVAQKSREIETRENEQRSILANAMLAIISLKNTGEILHSNAAAQQLLMPSHSKVKLSGLLLTNLVPGLDLGRPDGRFKLQTAIALGHDQLATLEIEKNTWLTPDGEIRLTLMMRDITVSERNAQDIAKTEQRWNLALMGAQIGVFDVDLKNQTSVVSDMWRTTMQITAPVEFADPYSLQKDRMNPDDLLQLNAAEAACILGQTDRVEARFRIKLPDGDWRWIQSDAVVVERAGDGTALRMLGTQMDITEKIKLDQIKRDFIATVSHELRTPLTSIKGALGLLNAQSHESKPETSERLIRIALSSSDRLVSLVNDILDMEKINAGRMSHDCKAADLGALMQTAAEQIGPYAQQWKIGVAVDLPEPDQTIWTDEKRILQILANLLSNACKFALKDSTVRLSAEIFATHTRVSVSNLGAGIPEEFRASIFQPFSQADTSDTRERGGTGLGLNISRQLVEAMGGTIGFDSEPGKETVFWFTCPLADAAGNAPAIHPPLELVQQPEAVEKRQAAAV